jgi:hypothetical protein
MAWPAWVEMLGDDDRRGEVRRQARDDPRHGLDSTGRRADDDELRIGGGRHAFTSGRPGTRPDRSAPRTSRGTPSRKCGDEYGRRLRPERAIVWAGTSLDGQEVGRSSSRPGPVVTVSAAESVFDSSGGRESGRRERGDEPFGQGLLASGRGLWMATWECHSSDKIPVCLPRDRSVSLPGVRATHSIPLPASRERHYSADNSC